MANVRQGLEQIVTWCADVDPDARVGLNVVLTDGEQLIGSRLNRSLYHLQRDHVFSCPICGKSHAHHELTTDYQAVEIASEPVTQGEDWYDVPNGTIFQIAEDYRLDMEPLARDAVA